MDSKSRISLKLIFAFILLMIAVTIGTLVTRRMLISEGTTPGKAPGRVYARHYAFIHTGGDDDLWNNIYDGARARGDESDAYVEKFGEDLTVDYDRNDLVRIAMEASVDGIIIDGDTDPGLAELVNEAVASGIPVVCVFNDCAESDRVCFVGFSYYNIGRQYGAELLKDYADNDITVYVVMDNENSGGNQNLVISGIYDEFAERGVADSCEIEGRYVNNETAFTAEEDIRDIFIGSNLPDAMVALNSVYTRCLFQAAVDHNKTGTVALYGFDDSTDILEAVSKGLLEATISVDASRIGASAVEALDEFISTGYVTTYIAQDTEVILPERATQILSEERVEDEE